VKQSVNRISFCLFVLLLLGLPFGSFLRGQGQSGGLKYFRNYTPREYRNQSQNWSVVQDLRGIIYLGNHGGLMEFDGISWREIRIPNWSVRSLAVDNRGTIYVGGKDEIGFLAADVSGTLHYVSLLDHLDEDQRNFSNVWKTHVAAGGIYFRSSKFLFRWDLLQMRVWQSENFFNASAAWQGRLLVHDKKVGLMEMVGDSLELLPGGEAFVGTTIRLMAPYDDRRLLVGTRAKGFFLYDGLKTVPFATEADGYLKTAQLYHGIRLSSGDFACATLNGGLVVIDAGGRLKQIFNKTAGLQDERVMYVFEDFQGNLWLALNRGVTKIEYAASPISLYDERTDLHGLVLSVVRHRDDLYVGTTSGLYVLGPASPLKFRPVPGVGLNCWSLLSIDNAVLAATSDGVFLLENDTKRMVMGGRTYVLRHSLQMPKHIWVGTALGLASLYLEGGRWVEAHKFENIDEEIRTVVEDEGGDLWLGTLTKGVLKVDFPRRGTIAGPEISRYHTAQGLPPEWIHVFKAAGHVIFASLQGIFRFDEARQVFVPDTTLGDEYADGCKNVFHLVEDRHKNIWFHSGRENFSAILQPDGSFTIRAGPFRRIPLSQVNTIYPDGQLIWFGSDEGLICYDTAIKGNYEHDFRSLIRKVLAGEDQLIFDGCRSGDDPAAHLPLLSYRDRDLRFEFAAPFFDDETATRFQYFLEGYDGGWSTWTMESRKEYTNLDAGAYRFRVRAENVYGTLGREAVFPFKILPPWYQTWWAFLLYALAAVLTVYLIVRWRSGQLQREKLALEQIVHERTGEIEKKNRQLEEQSEKLKEMDQAKSRFFANISHEFRTPLTLIMGPLEQMLTDCDRDGQQRRLRLMLRNSQRLLSLINQLLELSRIEGGKMKIRAGRQNITAFLRGIAASFELLAAQNEQELLFQADADDIPLYFDPEKIEEVISNLLSNAVKFTPPGGKITISVNSSSSAAEGFAAGSVVISVADTGPGIPREQLAHVFDRFYQLDRTAEHRRQGSGIGLAIVKEMVALHHGEIEVCSGEGGGTEFLIRLPLGSGHLKPEEIVEGAQIPATPRPAAEEIEPEMVNGDETVEKETDLAIPGGGSIVLVVEDSADVREFIRGALEPAYEVVEAEDGQQGVDKARDIIPDLIISDIMMPRLDGFELCRILKNDVGTSHIPIIMLTARASEESVIQGLETGADDYITKPFNTKILCARINNLIALRRHLQESLKREMTLQPVKISVSHLDREFIRELRETIEKNIGDPEFNVEDLGKKLYMSRATLYRKILALSGESPAEFVRSFRLQRAAQLLKTSSLKVTDVAFEVGFSSTAYFTKCFKGKFHQLPSTFQAAEATA
jgi:signal transduction histidine kinase/DNA-binding response OmpR family regulator